MLNGTSDEAAPYARSTEALREERHHYGLGKGEGVIRLFNVYYPVRILVLLLGEALVVGFSFALGALWNIDSMLRLNNELFIERGYLRILGLTGVVLLVSHGFDLYDSSKIEQKLDQTFRILFVLGLVAVTLGAIIYKFPDFLPGKNSAIFGVIILAVSLFCWRSFYGWLVCQPFFRERVYVLGTGERAERVVKGLARPGLGIEVVGWTGNIGGEPTLDAVGSHLAAVAQEKGVHRVIVAMPNRRGTIPVDELLTLRLAAVKVEEATSWLEKISGRIEVEQLYPSWFIFAEGFRFSTVNRILRRIMNFTAALCGLIIALPLIPCVRALAVKLSSAGPVFYRQERVGRGSLTFYCYKFRTMRQDAEADTGATWATDDDPRITKVGQYLRLLRLDQSATVVCAQRRYALRRPTSGTPGIRAVVEPGDSLLQPAPCRAPRYYRMGAGSI